MNLNKDQVYLITIISILCVLIYCKTSSGFEDPPPPDVTRAEMGKASADTLKAAGAKAMALQACRDMGMTEKQTAEEAAKIDAMGRAIAEFQPKIIWLPDADLKFSAKAGVTNAHLIKQEPTSGTTAKVAIAFLIRADAHPDRIYLGFRPLEDDKGVFFYVDRKEGDAVLRKENQGEIKAFFEQFKNYIIEPDENSIGFYFMVNVLNYDYTRNIQFFDAILKFSLNT